MQEIGTQQLGRETELAKVVEGIRQAQDLVDYKGFKVPRAKLGSFIKAHADALYSSGKGDRESQLQQYEVALKAIESQAKIAATQKDWATVNKLNAEIDDIKNTQAAIAVAMERYPNEPIENIPGALQADMGLTPKSVGTGDSGALSASGMFKYAQDMILEKGLFGQINDPEGIGKDKVNAIIQMALPNVAQVGRERAITQAVDDMKYRLAQYRKRISEGYDKATEDSFFLEEFKFIPGDF